jgi:hypothetical protein
MFSETAVETQRTTRRYILEDGPLHGMVCNGPASLGGERRNPGHRLPRARRVVEHPRISVLVYNLKCTYKSSE